MIEAYIRPIYQSSIVDPIARFADNYPPDRITCLACVTGVLVVPALMLHLQWLAVMLLLLSGFLDTLDGTVARMRAKVSDKGKILDIVSDRMVEFAVIVGLFALDPVHRGWFSMAMLGSCYLCVTSFLVVGLFMPNKSLKNFHYTPGMMERAEAFMFFILMICIPNHFNFLAGMFSGLVLVTSYKHIRDFLQYKESMQEELA